MTISSFEQYGYHKFIQPQKIHAGIVKYLALPEALDYLPHDLILSDTGKESFKQLYRYLKY